MTSTMAAASGLGLLMYKASRKDWHLEVPQHVGRRRLVHLPQRQPFRNLEASHIMSSKISTSIPSWQHLSKAISIINSGLGKGHQEITCEAQNVLKKAGPSWYLLCTACETSARATVLSHVRGPTITGETGRVK